MQSHEQDAVIAVLHGINVCDQCDILQKTGEGRLLRVLLILDGFGYQFVDIFDAAFGFICPFFFQLLHVTGHFDDFFQDPGYGTRLRVCSQNPDKIRKSGHFL